MATITPSQWMQAVAQTIPGPYTIPEPYRFTVDQYERMTEAGILTETDRVELINGIVVTKMAKGPAHVWAAKRAGDRLEPLLAKAWCLRREAPARIPDLNEPEPDLAVARGDEAVYLQRHPGPEDIALVAEVSDTTYHYDRDEKGPAYARAGIPVYWIINIPRRCIEVYTGPRPEGYQFVSPCLEGDSIPVVLDGQQLGRIAVADILPPKPAAEGPVAPPATSPRPPASP